MQVRTELRHSRLPLERHVAVHFERAQKLLQEGLDRKAVEELQHVADYDPQNVEAYLQLGEIYVKAGRLQEASRVAALSLKRKETAAGYLLQARVSLEQGKLEDAQSQLEAAVRLDPADTEAWTRLQELNSKISARQ